MCTLWGSLWQSHSVQSWIPRFKNITSNITSLLITYRKPVGQLKLRIRTSSYPQENYENLQGLAEEILYALWEYRMIARTSTVQHLSLWFMGLKQSYQLS